MKKNILTAYLPFLVRVKVYIDRARAYYAYGQLFALITIALKLFGIHVSTLYLFLGIPAILVLSAVIGWLDIDHAVPYRTVTCYICYVQTAQ